MYTVRVGHTAVILNQTPGFAKPPEWFIEGEAKVLRILAVGDGFVQALVCFDRGTEGSTVERTISIAAQDNPVAYVESLNNPTPPPPPANPVHYDDIQFIREQLVAGQGEMMELADEIRASKTASALAQRAADKIGEEGEIWFRVANALETIIRYTN